MTTVESFERPGLRHAALGDMRRVATLAALTPIAAVALTIMLNLAGVPVPVHDGAGPQDWHGNVARADTLR